MVLNSAAHERIMFSGAKGGNLCAVILAGGSGSRLWPISREMYPKQLLKLFGRKTLIQQTFSRLKRVTAAKNIYVVTNDKFGSDIFLQLKEMGFEKENLIIEPSSKGTAPAIGLAAKMLHDRNEDSLMLVCPADHIISPNGKFVSSIERAVTAARNGFLVTLGVKPDHPSSEYGYIMPCGDEGQETGGRRVKSFVEKPDSRTAEELIENGCLWNAGIFVWTTAKILEEFGEHMPDLRGFLSDCRNGEISPKTAEEYACCDAISIDYGVLEKCSNVYVVLADFKWRDIGSWKILYDMLPKQKNGNVLNEFSLQTDCRDSLIFGTKKRIAVGIGLSGLILVDTEDAVLAMDKRYAHKIKDVFNILKAKGYNQHLEHPTIHRPWGYYTVVEEGYGYKVKIISVKPKETLSLQLHHKRSEQWVVLRGLAKVVLGSDFTYLGPGRIISVPVETKHRLENIAEEPLEIMEVQFGEYLGEDDIVRFDDKYGRVADGSTFGAAGKSGEKKELHVTAGILTRGPE